MKVLIPIIILLTSTALLLMACGGPSAEAHQNAGATLQQQGDFSGAINEFEEAIRLDSKSASAYNSRGLAHLNLNQPAVGLAPGDVDIPEVAGTGRLELDGLVEFRDPLL